MLDNKDIFYLNKNDQICHIFFKDQVAMTVGVKANRNGMVFFDFFGNGTDFVQTISRFSIAAKNQFIILIQIPF